jgi:predicted dehydrogenase
MHILFIGYSRIVQKRVLPSVLQIPSITHVDIASQTSAAKISLPGGYKGEIFDDYETALSKSTADLVYVSTVNSTHTRWVEKALTNGFNVIVDKPSFTSIKDAKRLAEFSRKSNLCLAEATVYAYHPQIQLIKDTFLKANSRPTRLTANFSFPPLHPDDFRYNKELGGGAFWDVGPYAVSLGRLFFNEEPEEIFCRICTWGGKDNLETSFSMLTTYTNGRSMIGHFGFDTGYRNHVNILGPDVSVTIERIFTTPADMENEIHARQRNENILVTAPMADNFSIFLQRVLDAIQTGDCREFTENLLSDASVLHRLRSTALNKE